MMKKIYIALALLALLGIGYYLYRSWSGNDLQHNHDVVGGNGRIEATEVSIAAKLAGRLELVNVNEGDYVKKGQLLAKTDTSVLEATLEVARARRAQSEAQLASAQAQLDNAIANLEAAKATEVQKKSLYDGAKKTFDRANTLLRSDATSRQKYEDAETALLSAQAAWDAARASTKQAEAARSSAQAGVNNARANIDLADATIKVVQAEINDCFMYAPLDGRIQYRIAEPGEVIGAGGRVLNIIDLTDVYMTFFLPEENAGKLSLGDEVRIVLDSMPDQPVPAKISYVASVAQFTPKTVETKVERQKLMFRVKARIDADFLKQHLDSVKTGVPGNAWVKTHKDAPWPQQLEIKNSK